MNPIASAHSNESSPERPPLIETIEISDQSALPPAPLVSVYMLTFNHDRYVAEAIEGVAVQRCRFPVELIIGEDCSTDRTGIIVREYQRKFPSLIRILTAERNVGAHANAARCRDAARGRFIAICEGDDYWQNPNKLQIQAEAMLVSADIALCHTDFDRQIGFRVKTNRHRSLARPHLAAENAYASLLREWTVMTATAMYRADIVDEFRKSLFYEPRWPFGDYNLALYASLKGNVAYLPVSTATWRRVSGSASNSGPAKALAMHLAANECRYRFMQHFPVSAKQKLEIERTIHAKSLQLAFLANRPDLYVESLKWQKEHGENPRSNWHELKISMMRMRFPIAVLNIGRRFLRHLAEFKI